MPFQDAQVKELAGKLDGRRVKTREKAGVSLSYIEGWFAIAEANRLFGFDGWDREMLAVSCAWEQRSSVGCACTYIARVRIRVRAGETLIVRDGSGVGHGSSPLPGEAHESALKEAETDATKRALVTFGNRFGLALYDKEQAGVRRAKPVRPRETSWPVFAASGEPLFMHADPQKYCTAVRQLIEHAPTLEEVRAIWLHNQSHVTAFQATLPELKAKSGAHYADVLARVYERRCAALRHRFEPANDNTAAVDKSVLVFPAPKRARDREHLAFVAKRSCLVCGRRPSHAHHLRFAQPRALGKKVSDEWAVPLCTTHHRALHAVGDEAEWWQRQGIDALAHAQRLWGESHGASASPPPSAAE